MFNRFMMALARDSRGNTQTDLANTLGVGQGTVSKYESGLSEPPEDFVADMAEHLKYRPDFFYEPGRPHGMPPFHYRKRKKLGSKALAKIIAEINIRRIHVEKLLRAYEKLPENKIPEIDQDEYVGANRERASIDDIAQHLRDKWLVGPGPIENVIQLIESLGGVVVPCDFGTNLIDAMSQRIDGLPIMFFVNSNVPADRMRHTLVHELAHMILHTMALVNDEDMESQADKFAGSFLLPAHELRPQLRNNFNLRNLANLKAYWKVSMASIAVRADQMNLITPHQSKMFWIEMGRLGYRRCEPNEPPQEKPIMLLNMINYHRHDLGYSEEELSSLLGILPEELSVLYDEANFDLSMSAQVNKKAALRIIK